MNTETCCDRAETTPTDRVQRGGAVAAGGALIAATVMTPAVSTAGPTLCPFRLLTGLPCPGCGLTRSWVAFAHGDVGDAFGYNWFGPITFVLAIAFVVAVLTTWRRADSAERIRGLFWNRRAFVGISLWLVYAAVRLISVAVGMGWFGPY